MTPDAGSAAEAGPGSERMRALLARAAEEQLSEQRQVSAVLVELRGLVVDVEERLVGVQARLDELAEQVDALGQRVDELGGRLDATAGVVTAAPGLLQQDVRAAVADSERRLAAHVDDAVLALAGVLLRRRGADAPATAAADGGRPAPHAADGGLGADGDAATG